MNDRERAMLAQGLCDQAIWRGPRAGESCRYRARWLARGHDQRVCGVHARAYIPSILVEIGSPGWNQR